MSTRDFLFQNAIHGGDLETIKRIYSDGGVNLIDLPSDINCCTPLMTASQHGQLEIVKYLISLGASTNVQDRGGYTALMHGVVGGELDVVTYLVQQTTYPCDLLKLNNDNDCALDIARDQGFDSIEELLATELNKFLADPDAIARLAAKTEEEENKKQEQERLQELDPRLNGIFLSAAKGLLPPFKEFPDEELNSQNEDGLTPLMAATRHGKFVILAYLLEKGVALELRDNLGRTALIHSIEKGNRRSTQYLLISGCDLYIEIEGKTAWDYARENKHLHIIDILDDWKLRHPPGDPIEDKEEKDSNKKGLTFNDEKNELIEYELEEEEEGEEEEDEEEEDEEEEEERPASSEPESPSLKVATASPLIPTVPGRNRVSLSVPAHLANKRLAEKEEVIEAVAPLVSTSPTKSQQSEITPQVQPDLKVPEPPTVSELESPKPLEVKELTFEEFEAESATITNRNPATPPSPNVISGPSKVPDTQTEPSISKDAGAQPEPQSESEPEPEPQLQLQPQPQPQSHPQPRSHPQPQPASTFQPPRRSPGSALPSPSVKPGSSAGTPLPSPPPRSNTGNTASTTAPATTSSTSTTSPGLSRVLAAKAQFDAPSPSPQPVSAARSRHSMSVPASLLAKRIAKQEQQLQVPIPTESSGPKEPSPTHQKGRLSMSATASMRKKVISKKSLPSLPSDLDDDLPSPVKREIASLVKQPPSPSKQTTSKPTPVPSDPPKATPLHVDPGPPPPEEDEDLALLKDFSPPNSQKSSNSSSKNTFPAPPSSTAPISNLPSRTRISFVSPKKKAPPPPEPEIDEFLPPPPGAGLDDFPPPPKHEPPPPPSHQPPPSGPQSNSKKQKASPQRNRRRPPAQEDSDMPPPPPPPEDEDEVPPPPPPPPAGELPAPKKRPRLKSPPARKRPKSDRKAKQPDPLEEKLENKERDPKSKRKKKEKKPKSERELELLQKRDELREKLEKLKQETIKKKAADKEEKERKKNPKLSEPVYTEMQVETIPVNDDDPIVPTKSSARKSISALFSSFRRSSAVSPPPKTEDSMKKRSKSFSGLFSKSSSTSPSHR